MGKRRQRGNKTVTLTFEESTAIDNASNVIMCSACHKDRKQGVEWGAHSKCQTCRDCGEAWGTCPCIANKLRESTKASAPTLPAVTTPGKGTQMPMAGAMGYGAQYGYGTAPGANGSGGYRPCSHAWDVFKVGPYDTLHITAFSDRAKSKFYPELGIYFTTSWDAEMKKAKPKPPSPPSVKVFGLDENEGVVGKFVALAEDLIKTHKESNTAPTEYEILYPGMVIDWPDRGIIPMPLAIGLINMTVAKLKEGTIIETGCFGAHGRTGVFLALLLAHVEKLNATDAITIMRQRHCKKAIETADQVRMIFNFLGESFTPEQIRALDK